LEGDSLAGSNGSDTLWGGAGKDALQGSAGQDTLHDGDGGDALIGGNSADYLTGGDRFVFNDDPLSGVIDHVKNSGDNLFNQDLIDLSAAVSHVTRLNFEDWGKNNVIDVDFDVIINFICDYMILDNFPFSCLDFPDFVFG
jgi:Ca2+-binding RTX toxin-like protein